MSTCSNFMVNTGALFTKNFYSVYLRPQAQDKELLLVGRLSGLCADAAGRRVRPERGPGAGRLHVQRDAAGLSGHRGAGRLPVAAGQPLRGAGRRGRFAGDVLRASTTTRPASCNWSTNGCRPRTAGRRWWAWSCSSSSAWSRRARTTNGSSSSSTTCGVRPTTRACPRASPSRWPPTAGRTCSCWTCPAGSPPRGGATSGAATARTWRASPSPGSPSALLVLAAWGLMQLGK